MGFLYPSFLWFCLAGLLPWIFYFFHSLIGKSYHLPSLIFIKEKKVHTAFQKKEILRYLLQSIALMLPGLILSGVHFTKDAQQDFTCIVDDLVHTQWTPQKYQKIKNKLDPVCRGYYISLTDLSLNQIKYVNEDRLIRNENINLQNVLLNWQEKFKNKDILFIAPESNYYSGMEKFTDLNILIFPVPLDDPKNLYFKKVKLNKHPTDFRKRELIIQANPDLASQAQILIERNKETISATLDKNAYYETLLNLNFNLKEENIRILLQGDRFFEDNEYVWMISSQKSISYSPTSMGIPLSVNAFLDISTKNHPYFWFKKGNGLKIGYAKDGVPHQITFLKKGISRGARFLKSNSYIFQKKYVEITYEIPLRLSQEIHILARFTDGSPAIISFQNDPGGIFLFDPDSAQEELLKSPEYLFFLLHNMLDMTIKNKYHSIHSESDLRILSVDLKKSIWEPSILNVSGKKYILNWNGSASYLTGKAYPQSILFKYDQPHDHIHLPHLLWMLFLLIISILLLLDYSRERQFNFKLRLS